MEQKIIIDTGPLVAFIVKREQYHFWSCRKFSEITQPMLTNTAVLAEAFFLLSKTHEGVETLMDIITEGALIVENPYPGSLERVHQVMKKYRDLSATFADICLLSMADNIPNSRIMTLDQDFRVYRKRNGKALDLIIPG